MSMRRRGATAIFGFALALLAVEAGLRMFAPQSLSGSWLTASRKGYTVNRPSTSAVHVFGDRSVRYRLNSLGFRGAEPEAHGTRVLVVGDSVTFGLLLEEPDTYVARLASSAAAEWGATRVSFLNAAVGGWGTADYAAFVEDHGDELRPDVLLVFIGGDDIRRTWVSPLWTLTADGTVSRRQLADAIRPLHRIANLPGYSWFIEHSHAAQLLRQTVIASQRTTVPPIEESQSPKAIALAEGLFARLSDWCRSRGVLLLVSNGTLLEFLPGAAAFPANELFLTNAGALFSRLSVPYWPIARAHGPLTEPLNSLVVPDDGHPNERGAALIFDAVWPWLREELRPLVNRPQG